MGFFTKKYEFRDYMYAVIPSEETRLDDLGVMLCVLIEDDDDVAGLRFSVGKAENFRYSIDEFTSLLRGGKIERVLDDQSPKTSGKLPKYILTSFKDTYKNNLKEDS